MSLQSHPAVGLFAAAVLLSPALDARDVQDPCLPQANCHLSRWIPAEAQANAQAGSAVALHGDRAAVGAPGAARVHLYERIDGTWMPVGTLDDPAGPETFFGFAVAMSEDFLVVGAPYDETFGQASGAVHIYQRSGDTWVLDETLYDETPTLSGWYGYSVSVDGPWLGVGAPQDSGLGRAHLYLRTFSAWELIAENGTWAEGSYGSSIAVREYESALAAHVFVGDPSNDSVALNAGAVTHIEASPGGTAISAALAPAGLVAGGAFGTSLAFDDDLLVVGAPNDNEAGNLAGAVYVFEVEPEATFPEITLDEKFLPCEDAENATFGRAVDVYGTTIAVGARLQQSPEYPAGRVYIFNPWFVPGTWEIGDVLVPGDGLELDLFGQDVALGEQAVLVGSLGVDEGAGNAGAAYLFSTANDLDGGQCPCDSLAATELYGEGKPGTIGIPEIGAGKFILGESTVLGLENLLVGVAPLLMWGTIPTAVPMDGGTLLIADPRVVAMPVSVIGQIGVQFIVPDHPALCGFDVYFQALFLDPGAEGEYHTAQSRGLRATLGY